MKCDYITRIASSGNYPLANNAAQYAQSFKMQLPRLNVTYPIVAYFQKSCDVIIIHTKQNMSIENIVTISLLLQL